MRFGKKVFFKCLGLFLCCTGLLIEYQIYAATPRVVYIDPQKRYLVIDKPPTSTEYQKGARVCLYSRASFFLSCSAVVYSNRTKAALVLSKIDMEQVKVGMTAEVKDIFIKKDDPIKGPEFVPVVLEQKRLAQNKSTFKKLLEKGKKANPSFMQEIEDALKNGLPQSDGQKTEEENKVPPENSNAFSDSGDDDPLTTSDEESDRPPFAPSNSSLNEDDPDQNSNQTPSKSTLRKMSRENQEKLKNAINKLTEGASLDELQNAGWLAGLTEKAPTKPVSKKELKDMQRDMGANYLKTGDRDLLAMDMWDKALPEPIEVPPTPMPPETMEPEVKAEAAPEILEEPPITIDMPKEEEPSIDPLGQIQKIFVLPPPKPQKKSVRFDFFTIFQPLAPASAQALSFKKIEQADLERSQLWQEKDPINQASASFGLQMVMTRSFKHIYYLGYRTTFFQKQQFQTDYDANDYTFFASSETKFSASGSWFDYGRKMRLTPFLYTVGKIGFDLDSSIADFKSLRGNDSIEDHHLIAYGNSKLTLVSLRLGFDLGFHYWGFGFVGGINSMFPFYNARHDFNGGVSVPENVIFMGDPMNDLKTSMNHHAARYAAEVYVGLSYEPY